ncbi:1,4-alpha-glucan branching protein GlgB [Paraferrimonas sp. SM1919]|uniref:1,4-alpha-glucan branching protein GlgB n=1 Tax=Paraferrimonas sp. SM1919 TaxID=2662263 RepID=UPI0013D5D715|nr:1,4-alpha-glucan branching protein GlgB [Paraferrimonas sp. SM1919]
MTSRNEAIINAKCSTPLEHLGLFEDEHGQVTINCFLPGAKEVALIAWKTNHHIGKMTAIDDQGFFSITLKKRSQPKYRLKITYSKYTVIKLDPYQLAELRFNYSFFDSSKLYYHQGAHLHEQIIDGVQVKGVRFAVYAPNARSVSVIGDFNHWDGRCHPMISSNDGVWRLFIPEVATGQGYKFEIKDQQANLLPHKSDPFGFYQDQFPSFASRVFDHSYYQWQDQQWQNRSKQDHLAQPISIYELHIGSWRHKQQRPLTYMELINELIPYLKEMNYTHVEFMPLTEHPFDGSWGYQPTAMFAATSRYGSPDELKALIDALHQADIGVILDWVPAHFPTDSHGLANFDGTKLYEYEDPRMGWHQDWNSLIYDYGKTHVVEFLISSAMYWFEHFHIDGIRVDAVASMLYRDYARKEGQWLPNINGGNENYEAINFLKRLNETIYLNYPNALTIAEESTAFNGVTKPTFDGGLGFGLKWNMGWMNDSLGYISKDPIHRKYHHDNMTFSMVYAYSEHYVLPLSHDEVVHGKGSLIAKMPGDAWQQFANLRLFMAYQYAHPGKKLLFMGQEFAQGKEWSHQQSLCWHQLENPFHSGQQRLIKDLNRLYRQEPALHQLDHQASGFSWIDGSNAEQSIAVLARFDKHQQPIIVINNFTPESHQNYSIGVPRPGRYQVILNTDSHYYHGANFHLEASYYSQQHSHHGMSQSITLAIPPLASVYLKWMADES